MDYARLPRLAAELARLNVEELSAHLAEMATPDPDDHQLAQCLQRTQEISQSFMQTQNPHIGVAVERAPDHTSGDQIGSWKLLSPIALAGWARFGRRNALMATHATGGHKAASDTG